MEFYRRGITLRPKRSFTGVSRPSRPQKYQKSLPRPSCPECTKIARRRSLAIFAADEGIAANSAARATFTPFHRRQNRGSLATFFAEEIAHLGASQSRAIFPGALKSPPQPQSIARFWCTQFLPLDKMGVWVSRITRIGPPPLQRNGGF